MTKKEMELRLCSVISAINSAINATVEINNAGGHNLNSISFLVIIILLLITLI